MAAAAAPSLAEPRAPTPTRRRGTFHASVPALALPLPAGQPPDRAVPAAGLLPAAAAQASRNSDTLPLPAARTFSRSLPASGLPQAGAQAARTIHLAGPPAAPGPPQTIPTVGAPSADAAAAAGQTIMSAAGQTIMSAPCAGGPAPPGLTATFGAAPRRGQGQASPPSSVASETTSRGQGQASPPSSVAGSRPSSAGGSTTQPARSARSAPHPPPPLGTTPPLSTRRSGGGWFSARRSRLSDDGESSTVSEGEKSGTESASLSIERDEQGELKLGLGCIACIATLLEGLLMVYNFFDVNIFQEFDMGIRSELAHPFSNIQLFCLKLLGIGDLVLACVGAFGIWSCRNVFLPLVFETLRGLHSQIAISCLKALLVWRIAVTILAAPFLGIMLAFSPEHMLWHYCLAFMYLAASVVVAAALTFTLGVVVMESRVVQLEFDLEDAALRNRMGEFDMAMTEPLVFGRLPWGPFVFLWTMVIGFASFVWSVKLWTDPFCSIGGWAATFRALTFVASTRWLEMILYNLSWVTAIVGIAGIMIFNSSTSLEALVHRTMLEPQEDPLVRRDLLWELERTAAGKWQGAWALYSFFVFSLLRVALFFPLTGMALFQKNVCGFYVTALSENYRSITRSRGTPVFCDGADARGLVWLCVFFVVDCNFLRGIYKVWHHYHLQCALPQDKAVSFNSGGPSYGSADAGPPPLPPLPSLPASARRPPSEPPAAVEPGAAGEELPADEPEPVEAAAAEDDTLCPGLPPLPTDFVVALDSFRKLSAGIYPVPVLNVAGEKLIHMRLPSTPVQGYAVGGRGAWLELCSTETARLPQASIGPLPRGVRKRRAAEIRGRAGESYGELTPATSGWEVQRRGRVFLMVSSVKVETMELSASLPDGRVIATASTTDGENVQLFVDAGNDTLLVLLCVLAVILMSPRPSMLLQRLPPGAAPPGPTPSEPIPSEPVQPAAAAEAEEVTAAPELK